MKYKGIGLFIGFRMAYIKLENVYLEYPISYSEKSIRVELIEKLTNKNKISLFSQR